MPQATGDNPAADVAASALGGTTQRPTHRIRARTGLIAIDWRELWQFRDLLYLLAMRDIRVRYKQTIIGAAWAVLQPLVTMVVFAVVFSALLGKGNEPSVAGIPYAVSTFCALLPWQLFSHALTASGNSLVDNERLVTKIYFPRLLLPAASVLSGLLDFAISFVILLALMMFYGVYPDWRIVTLPAFLLLGLMTALGLGLWLSSLNALYRDIRYTIPFMVQIGMFVTPVVYAAESVLPNLPHWAQVLYMLNPMAGVIEGFRWALLGSTLPPPHLLAISAAGVLVAFFGGAMYFRRMEKLLADWI
jgi:lipopolysaccharide transport system permease protein